MKQTILVPLLLLSFSVFSQTQLRRYDINNKPFFQYSYNPVSGFETPVKDFKIIGSSPFFLGKWDVCTTCIRITKDVQVFTLDRNFNDTIQVANLVMDNKHIILTSGDNIEIYNR
ncbi:MAG: hypothetical protein JSU03_06045 [Bacteroidetes bacterium]|nr:hypothetical protein [Bacteroidota bacterium]MBS1756822.1 hypothetical protein [Bacteroidota bacterium]